MSFLVCTHCKSFVPQSLSVCPNCDTTVSKPKSPLMRKVINVAAAASISVTLSACYGPPCSPGFEHESCVQMLDQTLPLADQTLPVADQTLPVADQTLPVADQTLPLDQALPVADQGLTPVLDQALPAVDQSMGK
jgi:hypothetical protein